MTQFDCYAIYCPNNGKVYYIRNDEISARTAFRLRVTPARNGQKKLVMMASQFEGVERIFEYSVAPVAQLDRAAVF